MIVNQIHLWINFKAKYIHLFGYKDTLLNFLDLINQTIKPL